MRLIQIFMLLAAVCCTPKKTNAGQEAAAENVEASADQATNSVDVKVTDEGFEPSSLTTQKDKELTLVFRRISQSPCGEEVVFPDHDIRKKLPLNKKVPVTITPKESGTIAFACGMNMMKGKIVVQ